MLTVWAACWVSGKWRSGRDAAALCRPPPAAAGTDRLRPHPPARRPRMRRDEARREPPLPCSYASAPPGAAPRRPRAPPPPTPCGGRGQGALALQVRAGGEGRVARSADAETRRRVEAETRCVALVAAGVAAPAGAY